MKKIIMRPCVSTALYILECTCPCTCFLCLSSPTSLQEVDGTPILQMGKLRQRVPCLSPSKLHAPAMGLGPQFISLHIRGSFYSMRTLHRTAGMAAWSCAAHSQGASPRRPCPQATWCRENARTGACALSPAGPSTRCGHGHCAATGIWAESGLRQGFHCENAEGRLS